MEFQHVHRCPDLPCFHRSNHLSGGKLAVEWDPLIYCLESMDNPNLNIYHLEMYPDTLFPHWEPDILEGCMVMKGPTLNGKP